MKYLLESNPKVRLKYLFWCVNFCEKNRIFIQFFCSLEAPKSRGVLSLTLLSSIPGSLCSLQMALCWDKWTRYENCLLAGIWRTNCISNSVLFYVGHAEHRKAAHWDLHWRPAAWYSLLWRWGPNHYLESMDFKDYERVPIGVFSWGCLVRRTLFDTQWKGLYSF